MKALYGKAGLREAENSVINVIQCRPPNNIFPTDALARGYITASDGERAVAHCLKHHVEPFLKSKPWKRIDTFGDKPLKYILEKTGGVTQWRGTVLPVPSLGPALVALPTFHPAYIARDQSMVPIVVNDLKKPLVKDPEHYNVYPTLEQVKAFKAKKFAFDIETNRWTQEVLMVGLSAEDFKAIVVPFREPYIAELKRIFAEATEVIGQNCIQFDLPILAKNDVTIRGPEECKVWDIMLMHHLRFPVFPHDLEFIGKQFTNKGAWKADKQSFEVYCARDVDVTFQCFGTLYFLLQQANLLDLYTYISWPLALICHYMKEQGVHLSTCRIKELREEYQKKMEGLEKRLPPELRTYTITKKRRVLAPPGTLGKSGKPVKYVFEDYQEPVTPWRSSEVKKKYLYETLGLPVQTQFKTKKPTVDKNALDKLYAKNRHIPELGVLKELNHYATLLSSFAGESLERQDVLHPSFNVHGTESGRLSSSGPNIQNQPAGVRFMFVSRYPAGRILSFDFSGIENRIVAYLARDRKRASWLVDPKFSEHKYLVSKFYDIPYDQVQKSKDKNSPYDICKHIVHGCLTPETEVLTPNGWVSIGAWTGEDIACFSNGHIFFESPMAYHKYDIYDQPLYTGRSRYLSCRVTADHKLVRYERQSKTYRDVLARDWEAKPHYVIPLNGIAEFGSDDTDYRLAVAIQADASLYGNHAVFHLVKKRKQQRLEMLLPSGSYKKTPCNCHPNGFRYSVSSGVVSPVLGILTDKQFNANLLKVTRRRAEEILAECLLWDGCIEKRTTSYCSSILSNVVWMQTLAHLLGKTGTISTATGGYSGKPVYHVHFSRWPVAAFKSFTTQHYTGPVYCFTTLHGYFLIRHNGKISVTGNSDRMMGAKRIAEQFDIDFDLAKRVQAAWKSEISDTIRWQTRVAQESQRVGWTENAFGRKLWRWETGSGTKFVSFHPQSDAADVIYRAMIGLMWRNINWPEAWAKRVAPIAIPLPEGATLFIQVHDELVVDCKPEVVDETRTILRQVMTQPWKELGGTSFPIGEAEGASWGECGD